MLRNCSHSARGFEIGQGVWRLSAWATAFVIISVVIIVGNVRDVRDACVGDVHIAEIVTASAIPRDERFSVPEWTPTVAITE